MRIDYIKLQNSKWNTSFNIISKSNEILVIEITELVIDEIKYTNGKLILEKPKKEWAMFWDEKNKNWENHIDINSPIGNKITAFNAKIVGDDTILVSFGGKHTLGFSRWVFYVKNIKFETK